MGSASAQRGKALELHVGRLFGGRRRRNGEGLGYDDCVQNDGSELPVSLECKAHSVLQLRLSWVDQAERNSSGRPWIIVQRPKQSRRIYATLDLGLLRDPVFLRMLLSLTNRGGTSGPRETDSRHLP